MRYDRNRSSNPYSIREATVTWLFAISFVSSALLLLELAQ